MKVLDIGKHLVVFATLLFAGMLFFPVVAAGAAVEAGTVRVVLARQTAPVNFKVNGYYQLVNQTSGKLVANIQKDESWQVHLKDGQIQFQGPDDTYGPFSGPVVIVQGEDFDLRLNIITGDKKVVEKAGSSGLMAISAGGKAVLLSENSLSARSMLGMQQLGASAGPSEGLSLVSVQVGSEYKRYRGNMEFCIEKESLAVINELNIEDYLRGVVPAEMPSSWPEEALKAQAVVARNYALQKVETSRGSSYNLTNDQLSQVYRGYDGETEATDRAVEDTRGLVLLNRGNLISTFFTLAAVDLLKIARMFG